MTEAPQSSTTPAPESPEAPQGFSQDDVNKIAGTRAKEARQAAINDVLKKAGAESIDEVLTAYNEYREVQQATETEADRARKQAETFEQRAKAAEERYQGTLKSYAVRDALRDAGINSGRLPLALKVADMTALELDNDGNVSGIEGVVDSLKEASPEWFEAQEERRPVRSPQATQQRRPQDTSYEGQMGGFLDSLLNAP